MICNQPGTLIIYLVKGRLPWQGPDVKDQDEQKIKQIKCNTPIESLCAGIPPEFATYLAYTRALQFEEIPDYAYCQTLFRDGLRRLNH
mgnify:CR=1 FL=1